MIRNPGTDLRIDIGTSGVDRVVRVSHLPTQNRLEKHLNDSPPQSAIAELLAKLEAHLRTDGLDDYLDDW